MPRTHEVGRDFIIPWMLVFLVGMTTSVMGAEPTREPCHPLPLHNPGFESDIPHEGWSLHVYGAQPDISLDTDAPQEGRHALRVHANDRSDTAFGQECQLNPERTYRLRGWIRTQNLDPHGAPVCGTFQIQMPGGSAVIASGANHPGTNEWAQETLYFSPPPGGLTRIAIFFTGYGKGTGTAWFDNITLEEIDMAASTWTITHEPICPGVISPLQYGQFIEYLCALTPSMFAEKVFDGGFEGVPEYRVAFRKETDRIEQSWYPDGAVHRGEFVLDDTSPFNGKYSQRITGKPGAPCVLGISQNGLYVKEGEPLHCSLHIRAQEITGPVTVTLWGTGHTYATAEFTPTAEWQRFDTAMVPNGTDDHAAITISFRGPGSIWMDQISLMPDDNVFGWRRDVAEALKALSPGIIRFGGSTTEGFDWKATIGPPDRRVPFTTCWGGLEPGNAGLDEFVKLCEWVGAEPLICVRFTGKTPQDAAGQVEYFNGAPETPMGRLRAENGRAEPYHVTYWQIGNELGDETYQAGVAAFGKAMKAVDPSIKLLAAFPSAGLLDHAGAYLDYICPHHYGCRDLNAMEASVAECRKLIAEHAPGRDIRLGITEWNTTAGDWGLGRAMLWTLENALSCSRYHNLMHRHCDIMEIANRSNLADSFCSGIIQTNNRTLFKTPAYYAQEMYAAYAGQTPLRITLDVDLPADPELDASATLSKDAKRLAIFVVNHTPRSQCRAIDLREWMPVDPHVEVRTLLDTAQAGEPDAVNSWREPERIRTQPGETTVVDSRCNHTFPPLSLTLLLFTHPG